MSMDTMHPDDLTDHLNRQARAASLARREGRCTHGHLHGPPGKSVVTCLECGATFPGLSSDEVFALGREIMNEYL